MRRALRQGLRNVRDIVHKPRVCTSPKVKGHRVLALWWSVSSRGRKIAASVQCEIRLRPYDVQRLNGYCSPLTRWLLARLAYSPMSFRLSEYSSVYIFLINGMSPSSRASSALTTYAFTLHLRYHHQSCEKNSDESIKNAMSSRKRALNITRGRQQLR